MNTADRLAHWFAHRPVVTSLVLVTIVVGVMTWLNARQDNARADYAACVAAWADETTDRSNELSTARRAVDQKNDEMWRTLEVLLKEPRSERALPILQSALAEYREASDSYMAAVQRNPVPESPHLTCR